MLADAIATQKTRSLVEETGSIGHSDAALCAQDTLGSWKRTAVQPKADAAVVQQVELQVSVNRSHQKGAAASVSSATRCAWTDPASVQPGRQHALAQSKSHPAQAKCMHAACKPHLPRRSSCHSRCSSVKGCARRCFAMLRQLGRILSATSRTNCGEMTFKPLVAPGSPI